VAQLAHDKLKRGGKLLIVVAEEQADILKEAVIKGSFHPEDVKIRPLKPNEYERTHWIKDYAKDNIPLCQITATK
ncbi:MAG: hypothetical protein ABH834_02945, partial [Candidatus Altiarchaeota archaeon]